MNRRRFLQGIAVTTAGIGGLPLLAETDDTTASGPQNAAASVLRDGVAINTEGYTFLCNSTRRTETWKVYEDLRTREGSIAFVSTSGTGRVLTKMRKLPSQRPIRRTLV